MKSVHGALVVGALVVAAGCGGTSAAPRAAPSPTPTFAAAGSGVPGFLTDMKILFAPIADTPYGKRYLLGAGQEACSLFRHYYNFPEVLRAVGRPRAQRITHLTATDYRRVVVRGVTDLCPNQLANVPG